MVAVINTGPSIRSIFNYNENKIEAGKAELIGEGNYPTSACELQKDSRLKLLLKQLEFNVNVKRGSVHISLNFDSSESNMQKEKLLAIAHVYMAKLDLLHSLIWSINIMMQDIRTSILSP